MLSALRFISFVATVYKYDESKTDVEFSIWAVVGWNFKSPLIFYKKTGISVGFTGEDYQRNILEGYIKVKFSKNHHRHRIIQEDNDGAHGTKIGNNPNAR